MKTRRTPRDQAQNRGKKAGQTNEALAATSTSGSGNNTNAHRKRRRGKCHHCGKEGHWVRECCTKKKEEVAAAATTQSGQTAQASTGNTTKPENRPVGSANAVTADDSEGDGFWMIEEEVARAHFDCAELDPFLDDSDLGDEWEDFHAELEAMEEYPHALDNEGEDLYYEERDCDDDDDIIAAVITPAEGDDAPRIELYDSSTSRHISPHKADFSTYILLSPPLYLNAANQHKFPAIGKGTLIIHAPNNEGKSELVLHDALHAPSVSYTLVSLGALDEEGYESRIGGGRLHIISPCGEQVANIVRNNRRLYKVEHPPDSAYAAEVVSAMELHR